MSRSLIASAEVNVVPFISVVIPTHNRKRTLVYTLFNLLAQDYPKENFAIVIADDWSTDGTEELVKLIEADFGPKRFNILLIKNKMRGAASARNTAIVAARGEIIALTDDDVFLPPSYLSEIALSMNSGNVAGLYGKIITDFANFVEPLMTTSINKKYLTACSAYRKDVLAEVGMFSEEFPFHRGDSVLAYKILEMGYDVIYAPTVVLYHPLRRFRWRELVDTLKWSVYDPLLLKRYKKPASEDTLKQILPRFSPEGLSFLMFVTVIVVTAALFSLLFALVVAIVLTSIGLVSLAAIRSSYKGKPWRVRFKGAFVSLLLYLSNVLGRIIGSVKYRTLLV